MKQRLHFVFLAGFCMLPCVVGAKLTLVPVGPFGEPLKNCSVVGFRHTPEPTTESPVYLKLFRGLIAEGIPPGEYAASARCGDSVLHEHVTLGSTDQLLLVVQRERILVSEPVKPKLVITLSEMMSIPESWRIEFVGLYNGRRYVGGFEQKSGMASVTDPETGRYFVSVKSSDGYSCGRLIDLMEFTRDWRFDPASCAFRFDQYAHVFNQNEPEAATAWYEEMQRQKDKLYRELQDAVIRPK